MRIALILDHNAVTGYARLHPGRTLAVGELAAEVAQEPGAEIGISCLTMLTALRVLQLPTERRRLNMLAQRCLILPFVEEEVLDTAGARQDLEPLGTPDLESLAHNLVLATNHRAAWLTAYAAEIRHLLPDIEVLDLDGGW